MKKPVIAIIILEILLVIVTFTNSKLNPQSIETLVEKELGKNQVASVNYILKYEMPEGYEIATNLYGEVDITTKDSSSVFSMDSLKKEMLTPEDFFAQQEQVFQYVSGYELVSENTVEENGKKYTKKVYKVSTGLTSFYAFFATIELKNNPDEYIAIIGNGSELSYEKDLDTLISTVDYTKQKVDKKRLFSSNLEKISVTMPASWKRLEKILPYSFYKQDENNVAYFIASSGDKEEQDPKEYFKMTKEYLNDVSEENVIVDDQVEKIANKTITTSIIKIDEYTTVILNLIEFKGSDIFVLTRSDIVSESGIDYIKPEIDEIIKSIKLK